MHEALCQSTSSTTPIPLVLLEGRGEKDGGGGRGGRRRGQEGGGRGERRGRGGRRQRDTHREFDLSMVVQAYNLGIQNQKLELGGSGTQSFLGLQPVRGHAGLRKTNTSF